MLYLCGIHCSELNLCAVVPVESAETTSQHGPDNAITKVQLLCLSAHLWPSVMSVAWQALDGAVSTFYSSEPSPSMPVEVPPVHQWTASSTGGPRELALTLIV